MSNTIEERAEKQILDYTASSDWDQIAKMTWTTAEMLEQMRVFAQQEVAKRDLESEAYVKALDLFEASNIGELKLVIGVSKRIIELHEKSVKEEIPIYTKLGRFSGEEGSSTLWMASNDNNPITRATELASELKRTKDSLDSLKEKVRELRGTYFGLLIETKSRKNELSQLSEETMFTFWDMLNNEQRYFEKITECLTKILEEE